MRGYQRVSQNMFLRRNKKYTLLSRLMMMMVSGSMMLGCFIALDKDA